MINHQYKQNFLRHEYDFTSRKVKEISHLLHKKKLNYSL
jgi:hypothetical protein